MSVTAPRWQPAPFVLSYRLGEYRLFGKRFRSLSLQEHFFDLTDSPDEPSPPVDRLRGEVDVIITRSHPIREPLPVVTVQDGILRYVLARYERFHTDLTSDFEQYLAKFSAKSRSTLRRKVKRFTDLGEGCGMREYKLPGEMEEFHRLARQVSVLTFQDRLLDAGIPEGPEYLQDLVHLAGQDSIRAYLLFLHQVPIAYLCCPESNGVLLYAYLGYDPKHADLSPGTVLQYLAFQSLFHEKRFRAFDFTEGQGEHKRFFGTRSTLCADVCYFRATPSTRFWIGLHRAFDRVSVAAVRMLDRLGLKARVKRFLRRS